MNFLRINGAFGEGGGQIVRTAITLSCITKQPVLLENIRKNREIPGLRPQHLTAIKILEKISDAKVEGAKIGSTSFKFFPGKIRTMNLSEDVGTAGSISLILQVLIPVCSLCNSKLNLSIKGGTDVKWSPTIDYTKHVLREVYARMGIKFSMNVIKRGYYPKGGGEVKVEIFPSKIIHPISLEKRISNNVTLICSFSKIPSEKIFHEIGQIRKKLEENRFHVKSEIVEESALNAGSSVVIFSKEPDSIIGVDSLFNFSSQKFVDSIIQRLLASDLGVDENLADMIVVPASLADGMTIFRVNKISKHLETNLYVTSKVTGCKYGVGKVKGGFEVRIEGTSHSSIH